MAKKQYISNAINRTARPRSKRLRELGAGGGSSTGSTVMISGAQINHTHVNKADLDALTIDDDRYLYI